MNSSELADESRRLSIECPNMNSVALSIYCHEVLVYRELADHSSTHQLANQGLHVNCRAISWNQVNHSIHEDTEVLRVAQLYA